MKSRLELHGQKELVRHMRVFARKHALEGLKFCALLVRYATSELQRIEAAAEAGDRDTVKAIRETVDMRAVTNAVTILLDRGLGRPQTDEPDSAGVTIEVRTYQQAEALARALPEGEQGDDDESR